MRPNLKNINNILFKLMLCSCLFFYAQNSVLGQQERIIVSNEVAASGAQACVQISVEGFVDIRKLCLRINTIPLTGSIATFAEATNFNLPGLGTEDITQNAIFVDLAWTANDPAVGETVPDGTVLLEYCFDIDGDPGDMVMIFISTDNTTSLENINGMGIIPMRVNGTITIPDLPPPLEITLENILAENCINPSNGNGAIDITVTGGVPPYTFAWSNMTTDEDLTDVVADTYTVTVSDSAPNQNQQISSFTVQDDTAPPISDAGDNIVLNCRDDVTSIGGEDTSMGQEFEYQWTAPLGVSFVAGQNDPMAQIDQPGTYTFRVINTLTNCTAESMTTVTEDKDPPNVDAGADTAISCDGNGLILTATNDEGLSNISAIWSTIDGDIFEVVDDLSVNVLDAGTYTVILTNEDNGCTNEDEIVISDPVLPSIMSDGTAPMINCDVNTVDLTVTTDVNVGVFWDTDDGQIDAGEGTNTVTVSLPGLYTATATDPITNCTATIEVNVLGNTEEPSVNAGDDATLTCDQRMLTLTGSTDTMDGIIEWTDENENFITSDLEFEVNRGGIFILNVTNEFGCLRSDQVFVETDTVGPISDAGMDIEVACIQAEGIQLDGSGSDTGSEFTFMWTTSNGTLVSDFNTLTPTVSTIGRYDLVVTNTRNGCTNLSNVMVSLEGDLPTADAGADFSSCENSVNLMGNLNDMVTGEWTTTSTASIDNTTSDFIAVSNLEAGSNAFIWTLSTDMCQGFSQDTVFVTFESVPSAIEDAQSIPLDENSISFNVLENDNTSNNDGVTVDFQTVDPNFVDLGDGQFTYTFPTDTTNSFSFTYIVCSEVCPDLCDETTVSLSRLEPSLEPVDLGGLLPNVITPNGDGLNDALVFDIMLTNPEDFPNPELVVFNRWGDVVFRQQPYENNWRGTNETGSDLPEGTYYFVNRLNLTNSNILTGDVTIIRD